VSELTGLVTIPTGVSSSPAGSTFRNLCLSYLVLLLSLPVSVAVVWLCLMESVFELQYLVLWMSLPVSVAVWLAVPVGICVLAICSYGYPYLCL
jgi:hypothetical protein